MEALKNSIVVSTVVSTTIIGSFYLFGVGLQQVNQDYKINHPVNLLNISVVCASGSVILLTWYKTLQLIK
jgi:hypothetical protein